jgi:hypothetical protein
MRTSSVLLFSLFLLSVVSIFACDAGDDEKTASGLTGGEWVLVESAEWDGDRIVLTPDQEMTVGGAWYTASFDLNIDFDLRFDIYLGDKDDEGADGIVFVIATESVAMEAGQGLGYQGIQPSIGIEIDTYPNDGEHLGDDLGDPLDDHVTVDVDGSASHAFATRPMRVIDNIEDGVEHDLRVKWTAADAALDIYLDDMNESLFTYDEDFITANLNGEKLVRLGFTGSTGAFSNVQYIVPVKFESNRGG